ncbi:MAG TPA: MlaD family protein [Rhodanobacteraceae bacterium]|nr:MlaD family protein [Rhodanobacteraceae bacterium]
METRAHHILIGTFTVLIVGAALLFAMWLAKSSISKQYDYYDIVFTEAVTGLSQGGMVQYNGIKVGDVAELKLDPKDPRRVLARIRVAGGTPIKTDTRAKLGLTGLTGVAFIQLTGGTPASPLLKHAGDKDIPRIQADDSALAKLLAGGEDLVTRINTIVERASQLLSDDNIAHISGTLKHLDQVTASVADERQDLGALIRQLASASKQLNTTLAQTSQLSQNANQLLASQGKATLSSAAAAMQALERASTNIDQLLAANRGSLASGARGIGELGPALKDLRTTLKSLESITRRLNDNPAGYLLGGEHPREFTPE